MFTKRFFLLGIVLALVVVIGLTIREAVMTTTVVADRSSSLALPNTGPESNMSSAKRVAEAETARWNAQADYYRKAAEASRLHRSRQVEIARWNAQAEYYRKSSEADRLLRSRQAEIARWNAQVEQFLKSQPAGVSQRAIEAYAARLKALAEYYSASQTQEANH